MLCVGSSSRHQLSGSSSLIEILHLCAGSSSRHQLSGSGFTDRRAVAHATLQLRTFGCFCSPRHVLADPARAALGAGPADRPWCRPPVGVAKKYMVAALAIAKSGPGHRFEGPATSYPGRASHRDGPAGGHFPGHSVAHRGPGQGGQPHRGCHVSRRARSSQRTHLGDLPGSKLPCSSALHRP